MRVTGIASILLVSACTASSAVKAAAPVDKVLGIVQKLVTRIESEGKKEQVVYDKYACWCEDTTTRKTADIKNAKARITELDNLIINAGSSKASLGAQIEHLEKDIKENKDAQAEATAIREKEAAAFARTHAETQEAIGALEQAIQVLQNAGAGKRQQTQLIAVLDGVRRAIQLSRHEVVSVTEQTKLASFLAEPEGFFGKTPSFKAAYQPQSVEILGILSTMLKEFKMDGTTTVEEEASRTAAYTGLMVEKAKELNLMEETLADKKDAHAKAGQALVDGKTERTDTQQQLKYDEQFLSQTTEGCRAKANEWAERSRLRSEEVKALAKATSFLSEGTTQGLLNGTMTNRPTALVQLKAAHSAAARRHAAQTLCRASKVAKDERLVLLALRSKDDPFATVMKAIDDMLTILVTEGKTDTQHHDWCIEKQDINNKKADEHRHTIVKLNTGALNLESEIEHARQTYNETEKASEDLEAAMKNAAAQRTAQLEAFRQSQLDNAESLRLLGLATKAIQDFFTSNGLALLQTSNGKPHLYSHRSAARLVSHSDVLLARRILKDDAKRAAQVPAAVPDSLHADQDTAPDADFSSADSHLAESQGVLQALAMIKDDINADMKFAEKEEARAAADFVALRNDAVRGHEAFRQKLSTLRILMAQKDMDLSELREDITAEEGELTATLDYLASIKPSCEWIGGTYEQRFTRRNAEINGLNQAKAILRGAAGVEPEFTF